jgi:hypothetical protein
MASSAADRPTLEVVVVEASQHLRRKVRGEFGLALLDLSSSGSDSWHAN